MKIDSFESLLLAAAMQRQPQQLLLAFAAAEQEPGAPEGGRRTLVPLMCVAKQVGELDTFEHLAEEAEEAGEAGVTGAGWDVLLVTTLSGQQGQTPGAARTDTALREMVRAIQAGQMERFLGFDRAGRILQFS